MLINTVYPDGDAITNRFNLISQVTNTIDSSGVSVTNWFNNQGLRYAVSNAMGRVSFLTFDIEDSVVTSEDANGVVINNTYDDLHRLRTPTDPDSGVEHFGYATNGLVAYTNQLGKVTRYVVHDAAGRNIAETNANLEVTQLRYDARNNLTNLIDGKNQNTWWRYDEYSRVTNKLDHATTLLFVYQYDADSRLTNRWSAAKGNTGYAYDPVGNLTNVNYAVSPDLTLQYDALNRLTNLVDAVGTTRYAYDAADQLLSEDGELRLQPSAAHGREPAPTQRCHRADQNQPLVGTSKPASLRREIHNSFVCGFKECLVAS